MEKGNNELSSSFSLSELRLPTSELQTLQVTLISKIFHFSMYCCSSEWIQFWGATRRSCRAKPKTPPELSRARSWGCDHHLDIGLILVQEERTSSMLLSSSFQVPPAAGILVSLTLCKRFFQAPSPQSLENCKSRAKPWYSELTFPRENSPEKILISGVFQSSVNAFVFLIIPASTGSSGGFFHMF